MNWGIKIAIAYTSFVVFMLYLVVMSVKTDIHLVTTNYYEKELEYPAQMIKVANNNALKEDFSINYVASKQQITIQFPKGMSLVSGKVYFFRPSNSRYDFDLPIEVNANQQYIIDTKKITKGLWKIKVDWENAGEGYYKEQQIVIQ